MADFFSTIPNDSTLTHWLVELDIFHIFLESRQASEPIGCR